MNNNTPLVSIIVRTKDRPKLLLRALSTLAEQTYRPLEAVVVNDGGCHLDVALLEKTLGDVSLTYVIREENVGRTRAANIGLEKAGGDYVGFLDDDDEFHPDHVATLFSVLQQLDYRVAYADTEIVFKEYDPDTGTVTDTDKRLFVKRDFSYQDLLVDNYIPLISLLFERELLLAEGGFDESFDLYEDWDLLIRCASHGPFYHVKKITSSYIQWSSELQIAQSGFHSRKAEQAYDRVIEKHRGKFGPDVVRHMLGYKKAEEGLRKELRERETAISGLEQIIRDNAARHTDSLHKIKGAYEDVIREKDRELFRRMGVMDELRGSVDAFQKLVRDKDQSIGRLQRDLDHERQTIEGLEHELSEKTGAIVNLEQERGRLEHERGCLEHELAEKVRVIDNLEQELHDRERRLQDILYSDGWKLLSAYYTFREALLPPNSKRLLWAQLLKLAASNPKAFLRGLKRENIGKFFTQYDSVSHETVRERVQRKIGREAAPEPGKKPACEVSGEDIFLENISGLLPPEDKKQILVIDRGLPAHDMDSGSLRMFSILGLLVDLGYKVTFLPDDRKNVPHYDADLQDIGVRTVYFENSPEEFFQKEGPVFSKVLVSRPEETYKYLPLIRAYAINSSVIYDTVDLHWVRFERGAALSKDGELLKKMEEYKAIELSNASSSDLTLTVTEDEKKTLLKENPDLSVAVLPNIHEVVRDVPSFSERENLMFIGGFEHQPNEDAMVHFVEEIFPLVRREISGVKLFVVGSKPSEKVLGLASEDVEVTGYVKDVGPYFGKCRLFVSPLRYGAGMKGKIGQSMSFGLPVVTTGIGAEGIGLKDGETALIADTVDDFSQAVIRLYTDEVLWNTISESGLSHIEKNYSKTAIKKRLAAIFSSLQN